MCRGSGQFVGERLGELLDEPGGMMVVAGMWIVVDAGAVEQPRR